MKILLSAIYPYSFLLLYLIIPFDSYVRALPNILMAVLVIAFPFVVSKEDFKKLISTEVLLFLGFLGFLVLNATLNGRLESDFNIIKKVLITVGLFLLYLPVHDNGKIKRAIIYSSLAAIVFSIINIVIENNITGDFIFKNYAALIESLLIDRLYLGLLSVLSILISYHSFRPEFHPDNKYYLINIIINLLFLLLIVSKISLLILFFVLVLRQFYGKKRKIRIFVTVLSLSFLLVLYFSVKDEIKHQDFLTEKSKIESSFVMNTLTWDIRTVVWHCGGMVAKDMGVTLNGLGFTETKDRLVNCYQSEIKDTTKRDLLISDRYNSHNQFLDLYLSTGLVGLFMFTILLIVLFFKVRTSFFATSLLLVLISYCFVENIFHRQLGAYYAGFIMILLLTNSLKIKTIK